jgi:Domain of unknown function (DUF1864)
MKNEEVTVFSLRHNPFMMSDFEEALQNSMRKYSLRQMNLMEDISEEQITEALQKSMQVCRLAGINSVQHFKKIYVYDPEISTMHIDWRMTKRGLNLMVMQTPSINEKMARWLWELADL